jgi:hypothetical protein
MSNHKISLKIKRAAKKMLMDGFSLVNAYDEIKIIDPDLTYNEFRNWAHDKVGWKTSWRQLHSEKVNSQRYRLIESMKSEAIEDGLTLQEMGNRHGMSRERVRQILEKEGINVRELKKKHHQALASKLYDLQASSGCVDSVAAEKLGVSVNVLSSLKKYLSKTQMKKIAAARAERTKKDNLDKYAVAIRMWDEGCPVEAIAKKMKTMYPTKKWSVENMNQIIMRLRKKYDAFPRRR